MSQVLARRGRSAAYRLVFIQAASALIVSIFFFAVWGYMYGLSAFAGGIIAVLPNFVFATLAFSYSGASSSGKVVQSFFQGEAIKMLLTIVLFALVLGVFEVDFTPLLTCYAFSLVIPFIASLYIKQH